MLDAVMRLVGVDLQRQIANLRAQADDFKDRTVDELKHKIADAGITLGLAFAGLILAVLTLIVALIALYMWVAIDHGPFVALGTVGLTTAILAALLFTLAASRGGGRPAPRRASRASENLASTARAGVAAATASVPPPPASIYDDLAHTLVDKTFVPRETVDSAAEIVRRGPREAVFLTLAAAVVVGLVIGRRR